MARSLNMESKGAVITGGASGIGAAFARALLDAGLFVVIGDLEPQRSKAETLAHAYKPGRAIFVPCDVTQKADLEALAVAAAALPSHGASIWLSNAGISAQSAGKDLLRDYDDVSWKVEQDINIHAVIEGAQVAYRHMRNCNVVGDKFILATASMAGLLPEASPVYCANKAAVINFGRSLAVRLSLGSNNFDKSVRCYTMCPTFTDTPLWRLPGPEMISLQQKVIGGVARVEDIVEGFLDLLEKRPPSGSVCRVTLRGGGRSVVRDLMPYGKEFGGPLPAREGQILGERIIGDHERETGLHDGASTSSLPSALVGKGAVITGAASGIGASVARALLNTGLYVVLGDLASQRSKAEALAGEFPAGRAIFVPCDATKKTDLELLASAAAHLPCRGASVWFNNAGTATEGFGDGKEDILKDYGGQKWKAQQALNLDAVIEGAQVAHKHMKDCGVADDKFLLATASMAGLLPQAGPVYGANKAGVNHFTRALAARLRLGGGHDFFCYSVCPTFTDTPLWRDGDTEASRKAIGGVAQVQDIADAVLDLLGQRPPSGSICRVTLRSGGRRVVRDLVAYGKEAGGTLPSHGTTALGERLVDRAHHQTAASSRL